MKKGEKMTMEFRGKLSKIKKAMYNLGLLNGCFEKGYDSRRVSTQYKEGHGGLVGKHNPMKWFDVRQAHLRACRNPRRIRRILKALHQRPNKAEQHLSDILSKNNFQYTYVGDGKVVIDGLAPDFINSNGKKKIIELFGKNWHKPEEIQTRGSRLAKYGFQMLVIWDYELSNESAVVQKVRDYEQK